MENYELNECLRKSKKLIQLTERDNTIPTALFSGRTANAFKKQRSKQLTRLVTVYARLKLLKE